MTGNLPKSLLYSLSLVRSLSPAYVIVPWQLITFCLRLFSHTKISSCPIAFPSCCCYHSWRGAIVTSWRHNGTHYDRTITVFFLSFFRSVILLSQGRNGTDSRTVRVYPPRAVFVRTEHSLRLLQWRLMVHFLEHVEDEEEPPTSLYSVSQHPSSASSHHM